MSPSAWEDPQLVQIWGPRGADYVVPKTDVAVFTIGRMPRDPSRRATIESAMERIEGVLHKRQTGGGRGSYGVLGQYARDLRIGSITGRLRIRWDGSRIEWWTVDPPSEDHEWARLELARRFLQSLGPSTPAGFAWWSGGTMSDAKSTFRSLDGDLSEVKIAGLQSWVLKEDRVSLEHISTAATVRLLPAGDPYLCAADRDFLLPHPHLRAELWPKSVWPGALFVRGELVGTWRRTQGCVTISPWRKFPSEIMEAVEREVQRMPIESKKKEVRWQLPLKPQ